MIITIDANHFLVIDGKPVKRDIIAGGGPMNVRRFLVEHFTGGAAGTGAPDVMRKRGVSAHLVIDRDGSIIQCRAFNRTAGHAGGRSGKAWSIWADPKTGELYDGNSCSIGIEIANAGNYAPAIAWAKKNAGAKGVMARHRDGGPLEEWEIFAEPQMESVIAVSAALVSHYKLDDVTGHDCIAKGRKNDPGPVFDIVRVREACGFTGRPRVFARNGKVIS